MQALPHAGPALPMLLSTPADARIAVHLNPAELLAHGGARELWQTFVDPARERGFAERTGIDPRALTEVVFVERTTPGSYALLMRGRFDAERAVRQAGQRLAVVDVSVERPRVRREGLAGNGRWAYVALAPDVLLLACDTPPAELASWIGRYDNEQSALADEASSLARAYGRDPVALLLPEPLGMPVSSGAGLLMAQERALAVTFVPDSERFRVRVDLRGQFPEGAEQNFRRLVESMADTQLGYVLGARDGLESLRVERADTGVQVLMDVDAVRLARGLKLLFVDELERLFE